MLYIYHLQFGVDGVKSESMGHNMKWIMRIMPVAMFPFIINFPAVSISVTAQQ